MTWTFYMDVWEEMDLPDETTEDQAKQIFLKWLMEKVANDHDYVSCWVNVDCTKGKSETKNEV